MQRKAAIADVREETSAEVAKMRCERDCAAARKYELLVSILRIVQRREK